MNYKMDRTRVTRKHAARKHATRTWKAPHYRKSYFKKYGSACFLDPEHLRYPICTQGKVDCKALSAARYYAMMLKDRKVLSKLRKTRRCVS